MLLEVGSNPLVILKSVKQDSDFIQYLQQNLHVCLLCSYPVLPAHSSTSLHECEDDGGAEMVYSSGEEIEEEDDDDEDIQAMVEEQRRFDAQLPMLILPLYSMLPAEQQAKVI